MATNGPNLGQIEFETQGAVWYTPLKALLRALDGLVQPSVKDKDLTAPPGGEANGDRYLVGTGSTGAWSTHDGKIARYQSSDGTGWEFYTPSEGWLVYVQDENLFYRYDGAAWGIYINPALYATLASPTFTGTPAAPTAGAGTNTTQLATTAFVAAAVTAAVNGLSWKQAVRAASTANGTLATAFENGDTLDGVTLATGDRILLKDQSAGAENGIYIVAASGAPTRATDADAGSELVNATVYVSEGTTNADTQWTCTNNATPTLGSTSLAFAQLTSGGGAVSSVFGRTGAVVKASGDYAVADVTGAAPLASPTFTGTPTLPTGTIAVTQSSGDSSTKPATTAFVAAAIAGVAGNATSLLRNAIDWDPAGCPNTADASAISLLPSRSYTAVAVGATASSTARPTFETNEINTSLPIARFDGSNDFMTSITNLSTLNGLSVFIVAKQNSKAAYGSVLCGTLSGALDLQFAITTGKLGFVRSAVAAVLTQTSTPAAGYHLWEAYFDGVSEHEIVFDSVSDGTASSAVNYGAVSIIGKNGFGNDQFLACDVARIVVFLYLLPSADKATVRAALKAQYGI